MISFDYQQVSKEIDSKILHIIQYDDFPDMDGQIGQGAEQVIAYLKEHKDVFTEVEALV